MHNQYFKSKIVDQEKPRTNFRKFSYFLDILLRALLNKSSLKNTVSGN